MLASQNRSSSLLLLSSFFCYALKVRPSWSPWQRWVMLMKLKHLKLTHGESLWKRHETQLHFFSFLSLKEVGIWILCCDQDWTSSTIWLELESLVWSSFLEGSMPQLEHAVLHIHTPGWGTAEVLKIQFPGSLPITWELVRSANSPATPQISGSSDFCPTGSCGSRRSWDPGKACCRRLLAWPRLC